jgi:hypothetical protein
MIAISGEPEIPGRLTLEEWRAHDGSVDASERPDKFEEPRIAGSK